MLFSLTAGRIDDALVGRREIAPEHLGDNYAAVSLLVVFQDSSQGPPDCHSRTVQGMNKLRFGSLGGPIAYTGTPGLKITEITAGRNLPVSSIGGIPDFYVIFLAAANPRSRT